MNPIKRAWPVLPVILLVAFPALHPGLHSEKAIAVEGAVYQILGIGVVILGLDDKMKHFNNTGLLGGFIHWLRDLWSYIKSLWPWKKARHVNIHGSATGGGSAFGRATIIQQINHLSTQEQLDWLKKKVDELASKLDANDDKLQRQLKDLLTKVNGVEASISAKISEFNKKLGNFMTGSFKLELLGAVGLAVGVVFGTVPWWVSSLYQ